MKVLIIIPYFGNLPKIMPAFVDSCRLNSKLDFLIYTDDDDINSMNLPSNVKVKISTFEYVKSLVPEDIREGLKTPYKLCDYKPVYGEMFKSYLVGYDFWGYCDVDLILGKVDSFLEGLNLAQYDRLFDLGHLTLYRNNIEINSLYGKSIPDMKYTETCAFAYHTAQACSMDECHMNRLCAYYMEDRWYCGHKMPYIDVNWHYPFFRSQHSELLDYPQIFVHYPDGRLFRFYLKNEEIVKDEFYYMHMFQRTFYEIADNVDIQNSPYLITHEGLLPFDEAKIHDYLLKYSRPSLEEINIRLHELKNRFRKTKWIRLKNEIHYFGLVNGSKNLFMRLLFDHLIH